MFMASAYISLTGSLLVYIESVREYCQSHGVQAASDSHPGLKGFKMYMAQFITHSLKRPNNFLLGSTP
jgi:hypothetical protein